MPQRPYENLTYVQRLQKHLPLCPSLLLRNILVNLKFVRPPQANSNRTNWLSIIRLISLSLQGSVVDPSVKSDQDADVDCLVRSFETTSFHQFYGAIEAFLQTLRQAPGCA
jgi:hypothetical protein